MKQLKTFTSLLLAAALLFALATPAAASGRRYAEEDPLTELSPDMVELTSSMYYDTAAKEFVYPVANSGTTVRASVANGMIVTDPVRVSGATLLIYQDGEPWEGDPAAITEPGEYVVMAQTGSQTPRLFTFTLAGAATSSVFAYNLPFGMIVLTAARDGEEIAYERSTVSMQEDGRYHVEYECPSTNAIYTLDLNVDRTPPELSFSGKIDKNNRVHSALAFSGVETGDTVQVTRDGSNFDVDVHSDGTGELTQSGSYIITVYDAAGNITEYGYTIMLYLNAGSWAFFAVLLVAALAIIIYIFVKRKSLKIG